MPDWHDIHVRSDDGTVCTGDLSPWPCETVQAFRAGFAHGEVSGRFVGRSTEQLGDRDPNVLSRALADALDQIASLKAELADASATAASWQQLIEDLDYIRDGVIKPEALEKYDFEEMLSKANVLLEKVKDEAYERGESEGLRTAEALLHDAIRGYAAKHNLP